MKYGNRRHCELKILSWNSGHTYLINQMNEIRFLIQEKSPHILFISESNLFRSHDKNLVELEGFCLHTTKMIRCPDKLVSRLVAYVKEGILVNRREDLEFEDISAIWMEVGLPRERKYLICGIYREWAHMKINEHNNERSGSVQCRNRKIDGISFSMLGKMP